MHILKRTFILTVYCIVLLGNPAGFSQDFSHIEKLFDLRAKITDQGRTLPSDIKVARDNDLRTLERIFELNTSALMTIEAYFRLFKITITTESESNADAVSILNEWLSFIQKQCSYDLEYLNEATKETSNPIVKEQLLRSIKNIEELSQLTDLGVTENDDMLQSSR